QIVHTWTGEAFFAALDNPDVSSVFFLQHSCIRASRGAIADNQRGREMPGGTSIVALATLHLGLFSTEPERCIKRGFGRRIERREEYIAGVVFIPEVECTAITVPYPQRIGGVTSEPVIHIARDHG